MILAIYLSDVNAFVFKFFLDCILYLKLTWKLYTTGTAAVFFLSNLDLKQGID